MSDETTDDMKHLYQRFAAEKAAITGMERCVYVCGKSESIKIPFNQHEDFLVTRTDDENWIIPIEGAYPGWLEKIEIKISEKIEEGVWRVSLLGVKDD